MQLAQPVTFACRAPILAERKYSQIRKKLLAQVFGMEDSNIIRHGRQRMRTHLQGALTIGQRQDSQTNATSHDKSQTWFKAEIEELADVQSYKVKTEDGRILHRNCRHLCRSREPFYSSQPTEAPVALQPLDMAASTEKLQGPQPTEGQSFPTVPAQGGPV